jgi:hypothetical protein
MSSRNSVHVRSQMRALLACSGVALVLVVLVPVPPSAASSRQAVRIGLFGDSLAVQSEPYFNFLVQAGGKAKVSDFSYGGTAACDWLTKMHKYARTEHPQAVVFEFIGNTFTACMKGCLFGSPAAVDLYCSAISTAINVFLGLGTHVFLVGTPITRSEWIAHDSKWDALNLAFAALAAKHPAQVTYVDAGKAVEGPGQSFVSTLPCLFFEACTGPTIAGVRTNVVRSPDGVHFCPNQIGNAVGVVPGCDTYSSGAFRFAAAMAGPVIREFGLAKTRRE